jgi:hypothetical protein
MEVSKRDWKLFREKIADWQESYMDHLNKEYIKLLSGDKNPSDKFWALEKRISRDKKKPGVMLEMHKSEMIYDIAQLLHDKVICFDDLDEFSDDLKDAVRLFLDRR